MHTVRLFHSGGLHELLFRVNENPNYFGSFDRTIHSGTQGDALSPLLFNFVLEHAIKSLEEKEGLQLNGE